ncbi:MAG TPA: FAD:protein FMN transferase [Pyrinomonadaceae bacterium]|jgi:thiamine biosynthesis lipoprotein|nr:FAD:protein FMN transferase [Pyrinomonadaceae bacterium]
MQALTRRNFLSFLEKKPEPTGLWLHVNRTAMACRFEVTLPLRDRAGVAVATRALNLVDELEAQLSVFREGSEICFINREAARRAVATEKSLFDLLLLCAKLYDEADRAFDITVGPLTRCWGFLRRAGRLPAADEIPQARSLVGSDKLRLDRETRSIRFARDGMEINLGSIGKGYALDRVAISMREHVTTALLNAGASSFYALGAGDRNEGWSVGLRDPRNKNRRLAKLRLRDCALSTSGSEEQFFEHEGQRYGHIIDPRSGWPAQHVTSVSVVAPSAAISDALATAFYIGGREVAEKYCAVNPEILVIMLERDATRPVVFGSNRGCRIEQI